MLLPEWRLVGHRPKRRTPGPARGPKRRRILAVDSLHSAMSLPLRLFLFLAVLPALPLAAEEVTLVDRVQLGDNDLDCAGIATQVQAMDAILAPHAGEKGAVRGATESVTRSRTGEVVAGVARVLPFGAVFGDLAKDVIDRRGKQADARLASARARKEYLVDMFLKRGCRVADLQPPAAEPAGDAEAPVAVSSAATTDVAAAAPADAPQEPVTAAAAATGDMPLEEPKAPAAATTAAAQPVPPGAEADVQAAAAPHSPRGPLFVLDFRVAFRTRADPDGAAGTAGVELGGVPLTAMQRITDDAYLALLQNLEAAGFEVLNPELKDGLPVSGSLPAPARGGDYLYFAPSGAPLAQAPAAPAGSRAAIDETRGALAQAATGRRPGISFAVGVWYVDFARLRGSAAASRRLESRLAVAAGSHLALVEPAGEGATTAGSVRVLKLERDLASSEPYGQLRLPAGEGVLELTADPQRFAAVVQRQLKRGRSALLAGLPAAPVAGTAP